MSALAQDIVPALQTAAPPPTSCPALLPLRELLAERAPRKPWCCNEFYQNSPRKLETALTKRYIQLNPPDFRSFLVVDVDRAGAASAWEDAGLPPPTWISINPSNAHAHLVWALSAPVYFGGENQKPARFFKAVEWAFTHACGGDVGFAGLLTKNPLHEDWMLHHPAGVHQYDLGYLSEFVILPKRLPRKRENEGLGRNCLVFDELRFWAYSAVRRYEDLITFGTALQARAEMLNGVLSKPMDAGEVLHIARSVSKWTWRHKCQSDAAFSAKQAVRGKLSGTARREKTKEVRERVYDLHEWWSSEMISRLTGVPKSTVTRWLRERKVNE